MNFVKNNIQASKKYVNIFLYKNEGRLRLNVTQRIGNFVSRNRQQPIGYCSLQLISKVTSTPNSYQLKLLC